MRHAVIWEPEIEILAGREVPKVSPRTTHSLVQGALWGILSRCAQGRGGVGTEWRFAIDADGDPRTSLVPDVAFVSSERLAVLDAESREEPPFAPDIAIEVRSATDRIADVEWKMAAFLAHGAVLTLDVVPDERVVRAFTHDGIRTYREGERFECAALPWFSFEIAEAFLALA